MKKIVDIIVQVIIVMMLVLTILLPKKSFSENENRYLQKFPTFSIEKFFDGKYMMLISTYVADNFPFREELLNFKTNVFKSIGVKRQNGIYYSLDNYLIEEYQKPLNNEKIVKILNQFMEKNSNIEYDFMFVPTSSYILKDKLPKYNLNYDEGITLNYFKNGIKGDYIDVSSILLKNNDKDIYYHSDHHWTTRGAYLAYQEFCKNNNLLPRNFSYDIVSNDFYGTLYSKVIDNTVRPDVIEKVRDNNTYIVEYQDQVLHSMYDEQYLQKKDKYSYFLGGNKSLITITNSSISNNEILVIKDSYANSFIPLIANHYSKIHVIDPRYYKQKISDYIKDNHINHVLFLYNIGTIDKDFGILSVN